MSTETEPTTISRPTHQDTIDAIQELHIQKKRPPTYSETAEYFDVHPRDLPLKDDWTYTMERAGVPSIETFIHDWLSDHIDQCFGSDCYVRSSLPSKHIGLSSARCAHAIVRLETDVDPDDQDDDSKRGTAAHPHGRWHDGRPAIEIERYNKSDKSIQWYVYRPDPEDMEDNA